MDTAPSDPRNALSEYVRTRKITPEVLPALSSIAAGLGEEVRHRGSLAKVPSSAVSSARNDMCLASEAIRFLVKDKAVQLDQDTR
jgi:PiT family inorganic phosphate transporter